MEPSLLEFLCRGRNGCYYIGHASALLRIDGKKYLCDPIWNEMPYGNHWTFFPPQIDCDSILPVIDGVFISHIHADHVSERILRKVRCPVYIMGGRPNLTERLKGFGCKVVEVEPHRWFPLGYDNKCLFMANANNTIDSSVFIGGQSYCAYVGSDNFLNEAQCRFAKVLTHGSPLDLAMVPYAFIHWYPHLLKNISDQERRSEVERLNKQSMDQAEMFVEILQPKHVIPFGASLYYAAPMDHPLNISVTSFYNFVEAHPMVAGHFILKNGVRTDIGFRGDFELKRHRHLAQFPNYPMDLKSEAEPLKAINLLNRKTPPPLPVISGHKIVINNIQIDLEKHWILFGHTPEPPYTRFNFDKPILEDWLDGKITFEEAIGTRRFECIREPNVYNIKVFEFMNNYL